MTDEGAIRHELGHALAGLLRGASAAVIIAESTDYLRCDLEWQKQPTELDVAIAWLGGLLVPESASTEDRLVRAALPHSIRDAATSYVDTHVGPLLDARAATLIPKIQQALAAHGSVRLECEA
jgi:hypothetical protein